MQLGPLSSIYMVIGWCFFQSGRVKVLTVRMPPPTLEPPSLPWQLSANNVHVTWVKKLQGGSASRGRAHFLQLKGCLSAGPSFCPSCDLFHVLYLFSPIQTVWKVPKVEVWYELLTASQWLKQTWTWLAPSSSSTFTSLHLFPIMLQDLNTIAYFFLLLFFVYVWENRFTELGLKYSLMRGWTGLRNPHEWEWKVSLFVVLTLQRGCVSIFLWDNGVR